jgi:4-diphosphocytidyl-2-C-methyl-D-erythritol kinase
VIRIHAPAKVNLALRILAREESGFHQLETVFAAVDFGDVLSVSVRGSGISLEVDGPYLGPPEENLVYRAAKGFRELTGVREGFEIHLDKRIPARAGLGGGSSDAAAALRALASLFPGKVDDGVLLGLASSLGSDVPFFLGPTPLALAWGRGDRALCLPPLEEAPVLLAIPPVGMSTPRAYQLLAEQRLAQGTSPGPGRITLEDLNDWVGVAKLAQNDFEEVVFPELPLLARLRESLDETGARFSLLSGSGSTLFGVYSRPEETVEAKASLKSAFPEVRFVLTRTLASFPDPIRAPGVEG